MRARLRNFPLLQDVGDPALRRVLSEANWFGLPGGMELKRDGENAQALFLVVTGSLGIFVEDERGKRRLVAHIPAGETVGEMSLISGEHSHSAQIVALRDTELLRISPQGFDSLISRHPRVMLNLMRVLVKRLQATTRNPNDLARPKTFAIIPLQDGLEHEPIAQRIAAALSDMGSRAAVLDVSAAEQSAEWFNALRGRARHRLLSRRRAGRPRGRIFACARPTAFCCLPAPTARCRKRPST